MEQWIGSKLGKEYVQAVYCHPAYLTNMQDIMINARLDESQARSRIARRNSNNLRYADDTGSSDKKGRGTKGPLDKGERKVKNIALNSTFKKPRSWHPVPSLDGK